MESKSSVHAATVSTTSRQPLLSASPTREFHTPPSNVVYKENDSVFGSILRGELPALTLMETESLLSFQDHKPRAPLHALVIPKKRIRSVLDLKKNDQDLLQDMHLMALSLIQHYYPDAARQGDYILCYHIPPFSSVPHLHLHVLAPASKMAYVYRNGKYLVGTPWCTDDAAVRQRLKEEKNPVPGELWWRW